MGGWGHHTDPGQRLGGSGFGNGTGMMDDQMFGEAAHQSSSGLAIEVLWRRPNGVNAGNPAAGVQASPKFLDILIRCYLYTITPEDVHKSGGYYQYGDILLGLEEFAVRSLNGFIRGSASEAGTEGDRVVFREKEYRVVGQVEFNPIGGTQIVSKVHCRKMGLPLP